jgi:hypothetical protein
VSISDLIVVATETNATGSYSAASVSCPPALGGGFTAPAFGGSSSLISKRDSFGKSLLPSTTSTRHLGALLEEDEEEEEEEEDLAPVLNASFTTVPEDDVEESTFGPLEPTPALGLDIAPVTPAVSSRPRPSALDLRTPPAGFVRDFGLPTPPTATAKPGLRPLTLTQSPLNPDMPISRRMSLVSAGAQTTFMERRSSLSMDNAPVDKPKRPLSIAYKSGDTPPQVLAALPTPEATPVAAPAPLARSHSPATSEACASSGRPPSLSVSEQHFLFKSHNALLTRIEDLEHALAGRSQPSPLGRRPLSIASDLEEDEQAGPSDELLNLVADLKAERDELKSDVDGWRTRVADYERQVGTLARRVEIERRDAWVARERAGLLEVEKAAADRAAAAVRVERERVERRHQSDMDELQTRIHTTEAEVAIIRKVAEQEKLALQAALDAERSKVRRLEAELDAANALATPKPPVGTTPMPHLLRKRGLGFASIDSEATEVDEEDDSMIVPFKLHAVQEEDEEDDHDPLVHYEDEDEDESFASPGPFGNGFDDDDDSFEDAVVKTPVEPTISFAAHVKKSSLSSWTFPKVAAPVPMRASATVDRFFTCLDDLDEVTTDRDALAMTEERGKNMFCALANEDEEELPFFLPPDVGVEVDSPPPPVDEDESYLNDFGGVEVDGGIRFEFTLPSAPAPTPTTAPVIVVPSTPSPRPAPPAPLANINTIPSITGISFGFGPGDDSEDEEDEVFSFPQARAPVFATPPHKPSVVSPASSSPVTVRAPSPLSRSMSPKPSQIPIASPKSRVTSSSAARFIPQPRSLPLSNPVSPRAVSSKTSGNVSSGTRPPLSPLQPVPKAILRSSRCGHDDDPRAAACLSGACDRLSRPTTPAPLTPSSTPTTSGLWARAAAFAFGQPATPTTPTTPKIPAFRSAYVSRDAQLARLRKTMEAATSLPPLLGTACARCAGPVVHL